MDRRQARTRCIDASWSRVVAAVGFDQFRFPLDVITVAGAYVNDPAQQVWTCSARDRRSSTPVTLSKRTLMPRVAPLSDASTVSGNPRAGDR